MNQKHKSRKCTNVNSYTNNKHNAYRQPFNGLFLGQPVSPERQKGKTTLDFNEARDDEVAVA